MIRFAVATLLIYATGLSPCDAADSRPKTALHSRARNGIRLGARYIPGKKPYILISADFLRGSPDVTAKTPYGQVSVSWDVIDDPTGSPYPSPTPVTWHALKIVSPRKIPVVVRIQMFPDYGLNLDALVWVNDKPGRFKIKNARTGYYGVTWLAGGKNVLEWSRVN